MAKLTDGQISLLKLIARSPVDESGWRRVSETCCAFFNETTPHKMPPELHEFEKFETGGRVRLTDAAETLLFYS